MSSSTDNGGTSQNSNNNNNRRGGVLDQTTKHFKGDIADINGVIGLKHERIDRKLDYEKFIDKFAGYISTHVKMGTYIGEMIQDGTDPLKALEKDAMPEEIADMDNASESEKFQWKEEMKLFIADKQMMNKNKRVTYKMMFGQCSPSLQEVIIANKDYKVKSESFDIKWLMDEIRKASAGLDRTSNEVVQWETAMMTLLNMRQYNQESNQAYLRRFKENVATLELSGGDQVLYSSKITGESYEAASETTKAEVREKVLAVLFMRRACRSRYGRKIEENEDRDAKGKDEYPTTLVQAFDTLTSWSLLNVKRARNRDHPYGSRTGTTFVQVSELTVTEDGETYVHGINSHGQQVPLKRHITCSRCQKKGHYADKCPERNGGAGGTQQSGTTMVQVGVSCTQQKEDSPIPSSMIILDSASTNSCFMNKHLVKNISEVAEEDHLVIISTGGATTFQQKAECKLLPMDVWYNEESLANILSLKEVSNLDGVKVVLDTSKDPAIKVVLQDNTVLNFNQIGGGLYGYDVKEGIKTNDDVNCYSFVSTVKQNKSFFTRDQIARADRARKLMQYVGWPSLADFKKYISSNLIHNANVTVDDVNRAEFIYGQAPPLIQGKMTRQVPTPAHQQHLLPLPPPIAEHHHEVSLCVDFFFVNGMSFLHTVSRNIQFRSISRTRTRSAREYSRVIKEVINKYELRGFRVSTVEGDNEFDTVDLRNVLQHRNLMIAGRNEHVGPVERSIRTIKERARCTCHSLPYKRYPRIMLQSLIENSVFWLNNFPANDGVSETLSSAAIVEGRLPPDFRSKKILFGAYAIVFAGTSNTMHQRGERAIALKETSRGGHYRFMSLDTGRVIHSYDWRELPINDFVINRVHDLALQEGQPLLVDGFPIFEYAPGVPMDIAPVELLNNDDPPPPLNEDDGNTIDISDDSDAEYAYETQDEDQGAVIPDNLQHDVIFENDDENETNDPSSEYDSSDLISFDSDYSSESTINPNHHPTDDQNSSSEGYNSETTIEPRSEPSDSPNNSDYSSEPSAEPSDAPSDTPSDTSSDTPTTTPRDVPGAVTNNGNTNNDDTNSVESESSAIGAIPQRERVDTEYNRNRPRRTTAGRGVRRLEPRHGVKSYRSRAFQFLQQKESERNNVHNYLKISSEVMFVQMSAKKGIKQFGERAVAAMIKEYRQIDNGPMPGKPVVEAVDVRTLSMEQRRSALEAVNLIQEKRSGLIKGRTCANGSKQKLYIKDGEFYSSPTVSLEALFLSLVMAVKEGRKVAVFDVPGAYLHAEMPSDKQVLMVLRGEFVDMMCEANPEYKAYVHEVNGKKVLYLKLLRALYGCIESALLWYNLFSSTLEKMGFKINPYDKCVANKMVNDKQCTICWFVDDNLVTHVDDEVITSLLEEISKHFGDLKITRGLEHSFLGMKLQIDEESKTVQVSMEGHIQDAINSFGEQINSAVATPAERNLHEVRATAEQLEGDKAAIFHSVTAKLLHISKRARPDIETAVAFLCTRVSKSDEDDWKKLKRVLKYLYGTLDMRRVIGSNGVMDIHTWIDASYAVHNDMRSQTGGCISMGRGTVHGRSSKQKLNTKSSTEAEVVGMSEYIPYTIWVRNFLEAQGYTISSNKVYQDNQSAIRMEVNGRNSCTGNSRHIDIRYFFVKDRVDKKEFVIQYCPTELMVADFFTKPIQGALFRAFRAVIMGHEGIESLSQIYEIKERVGDSVISKTCEKKGKSKSGERTEEKGYRFDGKEKELKNSTVVKGAKRSYKEALLLTQR